MRPPMFAASTDPPYELVFSTTSELQTFLSTTGRILGMPYPGAVLALMRWCAALTFR